MTFWENKMFSSLSSFHIQNSTPSYFTNPLGDLFLDDSVVDLPFRDSFTSSSSSQQTTIPDASAPSENPDSTISFIPMSSLLRQSTRVSQPPSHLHDYHCYSIIVSLFGLTTFKEAKTDPHWQQAMKDGLQALEKTHTWDLIDLPFGKSVVGCK